MTAAKQKAPYFPFFYRDFWHAVRHMTKEEIHDYLYLLCEQADSADGSIPHKVWDRLEPGPEIAEKFELDVNGYFNVRMRDILNKRNSYIESRTSNLMGSHMGPHMGSHMGHHKRKLKIENRKETLNTEKGKEKEKRIVKEKGKGKTEPPLAYPFTDELFLNRWQVWKEYKKEQFNFVYKHKGEQAALTQIGNLSGGSVQKAVAIIQQSMANGWKGLFELDQSRAGKEAYQKKAGEWADETLKKHGL